MTDIELVKSITSHMDEKFKAHEKIEAVRHQHVTTMLNEHDRTLYGDPEDDATVGLRMKVDRLNTWTKATSTIIGGAFASFLAYLGFK